MNSFEEIEKKTIERGINLEELHNLYSEFKSLKIPENNLLVMTKTSFVAIKKHITWDKTTKENKNEQGGFLIGKPYVIAGKFVSVVEFIIPGEATYSNAAYLQMGYETWKKMYDIYDDLYREKEYFIVGWYHTHPNSLPVVMTPVDRDTQRMLFQENWHFSVVLNPHKKKIACFNSFDAKECDIYIAKQSGS